MVTKRAWILVPFMAWFLSCGNAPDSETLSPDEAKSIAQESDGKADNATWQAKLCALKNKPSDCDVCEAWGWYGESATPPDAGKCDKFCPKPDPDCSGIQCVQKNNSCCLGSMCTTLTMTCPGGSTPTYSCDAACKPQGKCPTSTQDATITIIGNGIKGFEVKVDNVSIGKEGTAPDPLDGNYTFKVKGNANHNIWITDGYYVYQSNGFFFAGKTYTIKMNPLPPPSNDVDVTIIADWSGFDVKVDGVLIGKDGGAPDVLDGKFSFKVKAGFHKITVWDGNFNYEKTMEFKKGEAKTIYVNGGGWGPNPNPNPQPIDCDTASGCPGGGHCGGDFYCVGGACPGKLCSSF